MVMIEMLNNDTKLMVGAIAIHRNTDLETKKSIILTSSNHCECQC